MRQRWEGDERGYGVADARAFSGSLGELLHAANLSDWVAEDPEHHLLPHIEAACKRDGSPWRLESSATGENGEYLINLRWLGPAGALGQIRSAIFELVGHIAEPATYIRQRRPLGEPDGSVAFEVVTGSLSGDGIFAPHGHAIRIGVGN